MFKKLLHGSFIIKYSFLLFKFPSNFTISNNFDSKILAKCVIQLFYVFIEFTKFVLKALFLFFLCSTPFM